MPSRNTHRSFTDIDVISYMFLSATVTARDDALSLCPLHVVHGVIRINCSYSAFAVSENVSLYLRSTFSTRPFHSRSYTPSPRCPLYLTFSIRPSPPYKNIFFMSAGRSLNGVSRDNPYPSCSALSVA